ncbi:MAG: hypothetical protein PHE89_05905 [Alphaproteobacteria bacterium]|nr:hypothetical protein [Alphaproteobacteria bacterium]
MKKNIFQSMSLVQKLLTIVTLGTVFILGLPLFVLFFIGFLPTITSFITNKKDKSRLITICCFNTTGITPYIFGLSTDFTVNHALHIVTDVFSLIVIYGLSAVGLFLFAEIPDTMAYFAKQKTKNRLKEIDKKLDELREEWGEKTILDKASRKR